MCSLEWHQCSWLKVARVTEWYRIHGGGGSAGQLLYLLLYVPVRLFVWCHGSFHLKLEFQAPLYELSTKTSAIWKLLFKRTGNWLRLLHTGVTIFILWLSVLLSAIQRGQLRSVRVQNFLDVSFQVWDSALLHFVG